MKIKVLCFFIWLCSVSVFSLAAQEIEQCKSDISRLYQSSSKIDLSKGYKVKYKVESLYKDKSLSGKEMMFTMLCKNDQIHVLSEALNTYADRETIISVSLYTKTILINSNSDRQFDNMLKQTVQIPDSVLWKAYRLSSCMGVKGKTTYNREAILLSNNSKAEVPKMIFRYHTSGLRLYEVVYEYGKNSIMDQLRYTFYEMEDQYTGNEIKKGGVYHLFFDAKGKLLPAYKNYEVIDQRNTKTNP